MFDWLEPARKPLIGTIAAAVVVIGTTSAAIGQSIRADDKGAGVPQSLTSDLVKNFLLTQIEMTKAAVPSRPPSQPTVFEANEAGEFLAGDPAATKVLAELGWTAVDFLRTSGTILETAYALDMLEHGLIAKLPDNVSESNVKVLQNLSSDVAALYKTWKETALDPALQILRETQRQPPQKP